MTSPNVAETLQPISAALQQQLRALFEANNVKSKTKTALKYEYFFLHGAYAALNQQLPPAIVVRMMAGRSILDLRLDQPAEARDLLQEVPA